MIAPTIAGDRALGAWFDALPLALRDALASEADRLARALRDQVARPAAGETISLAVESSGDAVTATLALATRSAHARRSQHAIKPRAGRGFVAPLSGRSRRYRRAGAGHPERPDLRAAFVAMGPEIRSGLGMAVRRAFIR
jgi:hypothetical protein